MAGPSFSGLIVERWTPRQVTAVKAAVAQAIAAGWSSSPARSFGLRVHARDTSAWLTVEDLGHTDKNEARNNSPLAIAVAKATGSPVWVYEYRDAAAFSLSALRILEDGGQGESHVSEGPPEVAQEQIGKAIAKRVDWPTSLLLTDGDAVGPKITSEVQAEVHNLAADVLAARKNRANVKPEASPTKIALTRASEQLNSSLEEIEKLLKAKDLDAFLDLTDSDDLDARFNATTQAMEALMKELPPAKAMADEQFLRSLEQRKGRPKNLLELKQIVAKATAVTSWAFLRALETLPPEEAASRLKFGCTLLNLAYLSLLNGDEVI